MTLLIVFSMECFEPIGIAVKKTSEGIIEEKQSAEVIYELNEMNVYVKV